MVKQIYTTDPDEMVRLGITAAVTPDEDGFRTDRGKGFFEWWYFDAHLDDGSTVVIVYMTKSMIEYKGPLRPNVMLTITRPDGVKLSKSSQFPPEEFSASRQGCDVRIASNQVTGDLHTYQLYAEIEEISAKLTFTGIVPPWRPRDGKAFFGDRDHYFGWVVPIPYGSVAGTLTYDGESCEVTGTGYHDHNWGNLALHKVQDHWYWGRAQFDDFTIIFVEQVTSKAYGYKKIPVLLVAKGNKILIEDGAPLKLKTADFIKHSSRRTYPRELDFDWESDGKQVHIRLRQPEIIEAESLLGQLPKWKQRAAGLFANHYYFRFNAEMDLTIDLGDIQVRKQGAVLYELMLLR